MMTVHVKSVVQMRSMSSKSIMAGIQVNSSRIDFQPRKRCASDVKQFTFTARGPR
jgi:hypothetical protein